jgi:hypothetical protein
MNKITIKSTGLFEPTLDYVTKIPLELDKFEVS